MADLPSLTPQRLISRPALIFSRLGAKLEKSLKKGAIFAVLGPENLSRIERCDALYSHVDYLYMQDSLLRATYGSFHVKSSKISENFNPTIFYFDETWCTC